MADKIEKAASDSSYLKKIDEIVKSIQYGSVTITVQDGKVIQIDKTEKYRIKN